MQIKSRKRGEVNIVKVRGHSGTHGSSPLADAIAEHCSRGERLFLMDLRKMTITHDTDVCDILAASACVSKSGGTVRLLISPDSSFFLRSTGIVGKVIQCYEDERAALESF